MVIFRNSEIFSYLGHFWLLLSIAQVKMVILLLLRLRYFFQVSLSCPIFVLSHRFSRCNCWVRHGCGQLQSRSGSPHLGCLLGYNQSFLKEYLSQVSHSSRGWKEYCPRQSKRWSKGNLKTYWFFAQANLHFIFLYGCFHYFSLCFEVPRKRNTR